MFTAILKASAWSLIATFPFSLTLQIGFSSVRLPYPSINRNLRRLPNILNVTHHNQNVQVVRSSELQFQGWSSQFPETCIGWTTLAYLLEADLLGSLPEALSANVEAVLYTTCIRMQSHFLAGCMRITFRMIPAWWAQTRLSQHISQDDFCRLQKTGHTIGESLYHKSLVESTRRFREPWCIG